MNTRGAMRSGGGRSCRAVGFWLNRPALHLSSFGVGIKADTARLLQLPLEARRLNAAALRYVIARVT